MFEDSTFETMGRIHTRSRGWMMATLAFNCSIVLALVIFPILHPEMLPQITNAIRMDAPTPVEQQRPVARTQQVQTVRTEMPVSAMPAPSINQVRPRTSGASEEPLPIGPVDFGSGPGALSGPDNPLDGHGTHPDVRPAMPPAAQHVSSGVMQGMLIYRVVPIYPAVARAIRESGTVILQATISRTGAIENLRVVSGPEMLRQAALDAVKQWRYRPYMLNGQPVEVETAVNVEYTLE